MLLLLSGAALAAYSTDIELVRPTFSSGVLPGLDGPSLGRAGTVRVGTLLMYERDPLLLYSASREVGAVVHNRFTADLGISVDLNKRLSARLVMPGGGQWGSEVPELAADGVGFGDIGLGARLQVFQVAFLTTAVRADLLLPLGSPQAYWGEQNVRFVGGVLAEARVGPLRFIGDVSATGRKKVQTGENFALGPELGLSGGAMIDVWPDRLAVGANIISRAGFERFWQGDAENPAELVTGVQARVAPAWQVDLGLGRGVADGYGTSQFRAYAGLTFVREPPLPRPAPVVASAPATVVVTDLPDDVLLPDPIVEEPPEVDWKADELARVEESQIIIRDPIQFELATSKILPESLPTLEAIATLLQEHGEIGHIVIEGHASEEGTFSYNYELSVRRSLAIFEQLILAGVHPSRLSCRAMGEVVPVAAGTEEAALAANRRVIFHIVRRIRSDEALPELGADILLPWNGDAAHVDPAVAPAPPPPVEDPNPRRKRREEERADPKDFEDEEDNK